MNHLCLFSGIGGFALAAKWMGWTTIGFSEIDPYASKILRKNFPDTPNFGDIRNITWKTVSQHLKGKEAAKEVTHSGQIDILTGGFP